MNFMHDDLGHLVAGQVVEVARSGSAANVRLNDFPNFRRFRSGRQHRYVGGMIRQSLHRMRALSAGRWHVTFDMTRLRGTVRTSARVLPAQLPTATSLPLSNTPSLVQGDSAPGIDHAVREHDVFISHASEVKISVVRPLAVALVAQGLDDWYDEFELRLGGRPRTR